jgi:hypothetical protein
MLKLIVKGNLSFPMNIAGKSLWVIILLLRTSLLHAEMTAFGERVDSSSTPDSSLSSLPAFPSLAPSPIPASVPQSKGSSSPSLNPSATQKESAVTVAKKASPSKPHSTPLPSPTATPVKLIEKVVKTGQQGQPEIHFFLRLPEGHTPEHPTAKGVLALCTWQKQDESLKTALRAEHSALVQYAKKNHLALLTWNTAILWKSRKSFDQLNPREENQLDKVFDQVAGCWESGAVQLCKDQGLPIGGWYLDGFSAGAHWSQRLAVRKPHLFLAVHIHVANSYDRMGSISLGPLWLVSSGDLDVGRMSSETFYRSSQKEGFPMILKICNGLGHAGSREVEKLRDVFFDYASGVEQRSTPRMKPSAIMRADLATSGLTGDLLTQLVFRGTAAKRIPPAQSVALPDEKVAKAWGYMSKK